MDARAPADHKRSRTRHEPAGRLDRQQLAAEAGAEGLRGLGGAEVEHHEMAIAVEVGERNGRAAKSHAAALFSLPRTKHTAFERLDAVARPCRLGPCTKSAAIRGTPAMTSTSSGT
jgi:hypothetical protein